MMGKIFLTCNNHFHFYPEFFSLRLIINIKQIIHPILKLYDFVARVGKECNFDDSRINGDAINTRDLKFGTSCVYIALCRQAGENSVIKFLRLTS